MAVALAAMERYRPPRRRTGPMTRLARCPECERIVGVIHGDQLVLQRQGRTIAIIGLPAQIEVPCVADTCAGIWDSELTS